MQTEVIEHPYQFTQDEKNAMATQVTELEVKVMDLEAEKKSVSDQYKAKIEPLYDRIHYFSRCVQSGQEMRSYTCRVEKDKARQVRVYRDIDTELVVKEEPYTAQDLQDDLPGMGENTDNAPAA